MKKIIVIGSASIDLVVQTNKIPDTGETVLGEAFFTTPGGKGANQAVAAARLYDEVYMIGAVGDDVYGREILDNLIKNGVDVSHMDVIQNEVSGTAHITLFEEDNRIIVVPSANQHVLPETVLPKLEEFASGDIILLQQEIPAKTVEAVINFASENGLKVMLNPAPYRKINVDLVDKVDWLTPNETESALLFEGKIDKGLISYPNKLIVTQGAKGATYYDNKLILVPGIEREVVDTTGAGDTFNGALAVGLIENRNFSDAILFANKAASFSVTGLGAQGAMPYRSQIE